MSNVFKDDGVSERRREGRGSTRASRGGPGRRMPSHRPNGNRVGYPGFPRPHCHSAITHATKDEATSSGQPRATYGSSPFADSAPPNHHPTCDSRAPELPRCGSKLERKTEGPAGAPDSKDVLLKTETIQVGTSPLGKNIGIVHAHRVVEVLRGVDIERVEVEREPQG